MDQDGGDGGIHSTAQSAQSVCVADAIANRFHGFGNKGSAVPVLPGVANAEDKIAEDVGAALGVPDFRVKLDAIEMARGIFNRGNRIIGAADGLEACGQAHDVVAVAIPHLHMLRDVSEKRGILFAVEAGRTIFPAVRFHDISAQGTRHPLHPIADSENRHAQMQDLDITHRRSGIVDGTGAAGEHDASGFETIDFIDGGVARKNGGKYFLLTNPPGDQLRVLAAEIEDDNTAACAHARFPFFHCSGLPLRKRCRIRHSRILDSRNQLPHDETHQFFRHDNCLGDLPAAQ